MTDAEYDAIQARILALAAKWLLVLGLHQWRVEHQWHRDGIPVVAENAADNWQTVAYAKVKWPYQYVAFAWNCPELAEKDDDRLEEIFLHKCVHVLVNEMREWHDHTSETAIDHEERVVTMVTNALRWTRDAATKEQR